MSDRMEGGAAGAPADPVRRAEALALDLQARGHHTEAERVRRALGQGSGTASGSGLGEAVLHALRDACQTVLTAIETIDPATATAAEELRLAVDARMMRSLPDPVDAEGRPAGDAPVAAVDAPGRSRPVVDASAGGGLDPALFRPEAISAETRALNDAVIRAMADMPNWWVVGAQAIRDARARGEGPFPPTPTSPRARTRTIPGRDGRQIPVRILAPDAPRGVYLHIHGGGWTLGAADQQDPMLERIADTAGLACVSVEYRLAPEHPYPAGPDDCEDAALWLIANARAEFGTEALTIGGESAGGHLAAVTLLRLRDRHGFTGFRGANLVFGCFDLGMTPSQRAFGNDQRLVLRTVDIEQFRAAFLPGGPDLRDPDISPLHADLRDMPPALFTIGTSDALLDDSLFMHGRWIAAGNAAELAVYPGGAHGFTAFSGALSAAANARADAFLRGVVG